VCIYEIPKRSAAELLEAAAKMRDLGFFLQVWKEELVSISSTLNVQIFRTNVFSAAFSSYMLIVKPTETMFVQKICTINVDEIDY
jgi:hypothetical protein